MQDAREKANNALIENIDNCNSDMDTTNWSQSANPKKRKRVFKKYSPGRNKRKRYASPKKRTTSAGSSGTGKARKKASAINPSRARLSSKLGRF